MMFSEVTTRSSSSLSPIERNAGLPSLGSVLSKDTASSEGDVGISYDTKEEGSEVELERVGQKQFQTRAINQCGLTIINIEEEDLILAGNGNLI